MLTRDFYNMVIRNEITDEVKMFAEYCIKELDARNEKRRNTPTKNQIENNKIKEEIIKTFNPNTVVTAAEIGKAFNISTQKASALLKGLINDGKVKQIDKVKKEKGYCKGYSLIIKE